MIRLGILASGEGTNAENLVHFSKKYQDDFSVRCVLTDNPKAPVIHRLVGLGLSVQVFSREEEMILALKECGIHVVCLAGFMKILSASFLREFKAVLNIHPSFLPEFRGLRAYDRPLNREGPILGSRSTSWMRGSIRGLSLSRKNFIVLQRIPERVLKERAVS